MTNEELRRECRAKEDTILQYQRGCDALVAALWPHPETRPNVDALDDVDDLFALMLARVADIRRAEQASDHDAALSLARGEAIDPGCWDANGSAVDEGPRP